MDERKQEVMAAHGMVAKLMAQVVVERARGAPKGTRLEPRKLKDRGSAILSPSAFWGRALAATETELEDAALGIKMAAAKLKAGDLDFVIESGLGQVAWLSAVALELKGDADDQPVGSPARARLLALSMRAQGTAAKLMLSLGALVRVGPDGAIVVGDDGEEW